MNAVYIVFTRTINKRLCKLGFVFFNILEISTRGLSNENQVLAVAKVHFTENISEESFKSIVETLILLSLMSHLL